MKIYRTNSRNQHFVHLVRKLDAYLAGVNGEDHDFYNQFNAIEKLDHVVVCVLDEVPVGCGAFRPINKDSVEIKRMFTLPERRGRGVAKSILRELENWASEQGFSRAVLETGNEMQDALGLYSSNGYNKIDNYGPYIGVERSVCFGKSLESK